MKRRSILMTALSSIVGAVLVVLLVRLSRLNLHELLMRLRTVDARALGLLCILMGVNTYLSSYKWRLIDGVLRKKEDTVPSNAIAFAVTSFGVAFGQVLPVQVGVSLARTLGTWGRGRAVLRGALGTLFEQSFDFLIVCFLAVLSLGTYLYHIGPVTWLVCAIVTVIGAVLIIGVGMRMLSRVAARLAPKGQKPSRLRRTIVDLNSAGLLDAELAYRLTMLSAMRFVVLVLMAGQTTAAIHSTVPLWHLAMAMPFVVVTTSIGITPGGLGVNEFTYATALSLFGSPLAVTTEWAIANRVLTMFGAFVVAIVGGVILLLTASRRFKGDSVPRAADASEVNPSGER